jgi:hypothetical protein
MTPETRSSFSASSPKSACFRTAWSKSAFCDRHFRASIPDASQDDLRASKLSETNPGSAPVSSASRSTEALRSIPSGKALENAERTSSSRATSSCSRLARTASASKGCGPPGCTGVKRVSRSVASENAWRSASGTFTSAGSNATSRCSAGSYRAACCSWSLCA